MGAPSNWGIAFYNVPITEIDGTALVAAANTNVVTALTPTPSTWVTPAIANQPKVFSTTGRCFQCNVVDANSSITEVTWRLACLDVHGRSFSVFDVKATPGPGTYAFATHPAAHLITAIQYHVDGTVDVGDTIQLRLADIFGLPYVIAASTDITDNGGARVDNAVEAAPTLDTTNSLWTPGTAPNGTRVFALTGRSTSTS